MCVDRLISYATQRLCKARELQCDTMMGERIKQFDIKYFIELITFLEKSLLNKVD